MKKIALISTSYFPNIWNSHGRSTFSIAYGLASKGHDVTVYAFNSNLDAARQQDGQVQIVFVEGDTSRQTKVTTLPFAELDIWNKHVATLLDSQKYDVIILNSWHGWLAAKAYGKAKIIAFIPQLYSFTGWLKPLADNLENEIRAIENECITHSDILVSHTMKFANKLACYCNKNVYVIPNCYLDLSNSGNKEIEKTKNQICVVGRVNREKCLERIIRVLPDLPEATLIVASLEKNQGYLATLEKLAKELDVEHKITFTEWMSTKDVRDLYKKSSLAVVTSQFEPYGYAILDPMALGTQVIVSEWSLLAEYGGEDAQIFCNLKILQDKIAKALMNTTQDLQANKDRASNVYSEAVITSLIESIL
jgi:glycosyltransferase involved in cell wall biosynthesis